MPVTRHSPIAEQVASLLHSRIVQGAYGVHGRLPSESSLADELRVSRGTVRSALATLAGVGLVLRRQGDGTYVTGLNPSENSLMYAIWGFTHLIEAAGRTPSIRSGSIERRPATAREADALELRPSDDVVSVTRSFYADEQPIVLSSNVSPTTLFAVECEQLEPRLGLQEFLERFCHQQIGRVDVQVSAAMADEDVRRALSLGPSTAILRIEEIFRDVDRRPLVFAINYLAETSVSLRDVRPWYSGGSSR
jgi:DNA-binding GntR family transcriptional regulator